MISFCPTGWPVSLPGYILYSVISENAIKQSKTNNLGQYSHKSCVFTWTQRVGITYVSMAVYKAFWSHWFFEMR